MDHLTKATTSLAAICWIICCAALVSLYGGNLTAINAVIGCSIPGLAFTAAAIAFHRTHRPRSPRHGQHRH
ncbi:hypothetical protein [Streptomyces sp. W4I9-2]|uniref:hypothetical protein n=1 Tax=Streptomyces sp. W4I9-2 TaxID=3042297 RepID=UPI00277DC051|nr:hypothetical protein [Streptomyces sp. W4I9-2]MDQ0694212.1 hypothetical protein [Streptomyces sp. W4I9-2]